MPKNNKKSKSKIQAVLFDIKYFNEKQAIKHLKKEKMKPIKKVHKTEKYLRYRIREPKEFKRFRILKTDKHIAFIIGFTK